MTCAAASAALCGACMGPARSIAAQPSIAASPAPERPGLGTTFGEQVYSPVQILPFVRASAAPWALALYYNDEGGAEAHAQYLGDAPGPLVVPAGDGAVSVALVDELGRTLPGFAAGGKPFVVGRDGERYKIRIHDETPARFEVVASVDGLDVLDGQPASPERRGYIVEPYGDLTIDGFRTSNDNVAAFRFGRVADSYAARTSGDRDVGVIGLAIFAERGARWTIPQNAWTPGELHERDTADPFPAREYAQPPE